MRMGRGNKLFDEIATHPGYPSWKAALLAEMPTSKDPDKYLVKELNGIYNMFLKVAKDRAPTPAEIQHAVATGQDPKKIDVGGGGDFVLTREEFVRRGSHTRTPNACTHNRHSIFYHALFVVHSLLTCSLCLVQIRAEFRAEGQGDTSVALRLLWMFGPTRYAHADRSDYSSCRPRR